MQEVTCFHCATANLITPDATLCPDCGEDLQHLLAAEETARYYCDRAEALSAHGDTLAALAEAERGLTYASTSELHLLAAILSKQNGRFDQMRQHVAAIAVDDSLRGEAEWLLRSHQDRQRALREAAQQERNRPLAQLATPAVATNIPGTVPNITYASGTSASATAFLDDLLGRQAAPVARTTQRPPLLPITLVAVAATVVLASWWLVGPGALPAATSPAAQEAGALPVVEPTLPAPTATSARETDAQDNAGVAPTATLNLLPTPTTTPAVPANVVQAPANTTLAQSIADANPRRAVLIESTDFDLAQYLRVGGYPELAELAINAQLQGDRLVLQGIVHLDLQRRQVLQLVQGIPGVAEVNAVELLLRPQPTYVVQEGDTLWTIVNNIYGNVDQMDAFIDHNRALLPAVDAIAPGTELQVMPLE